VRNQEDTIKEWQETRKTQDFDSAVQEQKQLPHKIKSLLATKRIPIDNTGKTKTEGGARSFSRWRNVHKEENWAAAACDRSPGPAACDGSESDRTEILHTQRLAGNNSTPQPNRAATKQGAGPQGQWIEMQSQLRKQRPWLGKSDRYESPSSTAWSCVGNPASEKTKARLTSAHSGRNEILPRKQKQKWQQPQDRKHDWIWQHQNKMVKNT
jgi:hypothetical protein